MPTIAADDTDAVAACLAELRRALDDKRLTHVHLLFTDGMEARLRRSNRMRFWRSGTKVLD